MSLDIRHMLKVYNYVNDEKRPKVNLKFLGLFVAFLVAGVGLIAFAVTQLSGSSDPPVAAQQKSDYVGLSPAEAVAGSVGANVVDARLESWYAAHPDAQVQKVEPVYEDGRLIGYTITYTEEPR